MVIAPSKFRLPKLEPARLSGWMEAYLEDPMLKAQVLLSNKIRNPKLSEPT